MYRNVVTFMLAVAASSAFAAEPVCTAAVAPPAEFASWTSPAAMNAGSEAAKAPLLPVGKAAAATLLHTADVHYAARPEKPGDAAGYGGLFTLEVARAGTYRIALSTAAWLDVVGRQGPLHSTAHSHGADCTGIRKQVDFVLAPGRYTLQISANGAPQITILAVPTT